MQDKQKVNVQLGYNREKKNNSNLEKSLQGLIV